VSGPVMSILGERDDRQIRARQQSLHGHLAEIVRRVPSVACISIYGRTGTLLVSSSTYPVGIQSIGDRSVLFADRQDAEAKIDISHPLQMSDPVAEVFNLTLPRYNAAGHVIGLLVISLRRDYFDSFYKALTAHDNALSIGLFRSDGTTLARFPPPRARRAPVSNQPLMEAIRASSQSGHLSIFSTLDGVQKLIAYRQVGSYPLYVTSGIPVSAVTYRWLWSSPLILRTRGAS
jgi:hypothetical protein